MIMHSVAVNIGIQICLWTCVFISLRHAPRSGITALLCVSIQAFGDERILCSLLGEPVEVEVLVALILCVCLF